MANGSFISNTGTNLEIGAEWSAVANASGNYSVVRVDVFLTHYSIYCAALSGSYIKIGDSVFSFSKGVSRSENTLAKTYIASYETTVPHLSDGTKSINIEVGWSFKGTYNGTYIGMLEASKNVELDAIPRASTFTVSQSITLGSKVTVGIRSYLSSHRHKLYFKVGAKEYYTDYISGSSCEVAVPSELAEGITNSSEAVGTVTLYTYNSGGSLLGENSTNATYTVPHTAQFSPDFTFAIAPVSCHSLLDDNGIYASGISKVRASVTEQTAKHGASVSSCEITVGTVKKSGYTIESDYLSSGNVTVTARVTDTRGISTQKSYTVEVLLYRKPYSSSVAVFRCDENGDGSDSGSYIRAFANARCSALGGINQSSLQLSYKAHSSDTYTEKISIASGEAIIIPAGLTAESSYDVKITCTDTVGNSTEYVAQIPTANADLHLKNGSVRFGGFCEKEGFDCNWDANFGGSVSIGEVPVSDFVIETGKNGIFNWRKWNSGISECYGNTGIKSYEITEQWGALYRSAEPQNSLYYPYGLFLEPPVVQAQISQAAPVIISVVRSSEGSVTYSPAFYAVSPVSSTVSASIDLYCVGKWK